MAGLNPVEATQAAITEAVRVDELDRAATLNASLGGPDVDNFLV